MPRCKNGWAEGFSVGDIVHFMEAKPGDLPVTGLFMSNDKVHGQFAA